MTEVFQNLARTAARAQGFPALRLLVLPHPMEGREPEWVRKIARDRIDEIVALLSSSSRAT